MSMREGAGLVIGEKISDKRGFPTDTWWSPTVLIPILTFVLIPEVAVCPLVVELPHLGRHFDLLFYVLVGLLVHTQEVQEVCFR